MARSWVRGIDIGGIDLEQFLFAEEIEDEKIEIVQKAAEKIKLAVDAVNKKIEEGKKNRAGASEDKNADDEQIQKDLERFRKIRKDLKRFRKNRMMLR